MAEQNILGAAMLARDVAPVVAGLDPNVFYTPAHALIAEAIQRLHLAGTPVDTGTVSQLLREDGQLDAAGGMAALTGLTANCGYLGAQRAQVDAALLERLAGKHRILKLAYAVSEGVYNGADLAGLAAELAGTIENVEAATISTWEPVNLAEILAGEGVEEPPHILRRQDGHCLLYAGKIHAFNAEPESGKSWLWLWAAVEVIERGGHVLVYDFEDSAASIVERLLALGADPGQILDRVHYVRPDEPVDLGAAAKVKAALAAWPIELAVVDGVAEALALSGWNEDKAPDFLAFLTTLVRPLARSGAAVVMVDHVAKDPEARRGTARGTGAKKAAGHVAIELAVVKPFGRDRDGLVKVRVTKDRPGWVRGAAVDGRLWAELHVRSSDMGTSVTMELRVPERTGIDEPATGFRPTELMGRVSTWLASNGPASVNDIKAGVAGRGQWVGRAVQLLVAEGYARKGPDGVSHVRRYDPATSDDGEGMKDDF